jgi:small redox-active disulfide protein 2
MEIKILGTGCARCQQLEKVVKKVIQDSGIVASIEHVTDIQKIMEYPILTTPGLVIDGKVVASGRVPGEKEIKSIFLSQIIKKKTDE